MPGNCSGSSSRWFDLLGCSLQQHGCLTSAVPGASQWVRRSIVHGVAAHGEPPQVGLPPHTSPFRRD
jgi:hypothetical protein